MNDFVQAINMIEASKNILILSHRSPDGDTIGSALAMYAILSEKGKKVTVGCSDPVPDFLHFLPNSSVIRVTEGLLDLLNNSLFRKELDLIIVVDTGDFNQLGEVYIYHKALFEEKPLLNFDHHSSNTFFGTTNIVISDYSSNAEVMWEFIKKGNYRANGEIATSLMTGLITDTKRFSTSNVNDHTLQCAAELTSAGARITNIIIHTEKSPSLEILQLHSKLLCKLQTERDNKIAWLAIELNEVNEKHIPGLAGELASTLSGSDGVKVGLVFNEKSEGVIRVNFRSHQDVSIVEIATKYGGGGHPQAAGCTITGVTLQNAIESVLTDIRKLTL